MNYPRIVNKCYAALRRPVALSPMCVNGPQALYRWAYGENGAPLSEGRSGNMKCLIFNGLTFNVSFKKAQTGRERLAGVVFFAYLCTRFIEIRPYWLGCFLVDTNGAEVCR